MKKIVGLNGFGRFGLHLLKYWLERSKDSKFIIKYINDDILKIDQIIEIIQNDDYVKFPKYKFKLINDELTVLSPDGDENIIYLTNSENNKIKWLGKPDIFCESSGKNTLSKDCEIYIKENTKLVVISATSWDCDKTIVFGFNHKEYSNNYKIISYGSCTVNAYVPLAKYIHDIYQIEDSDVNVIHNIQKYKLEKNYTLTRKFCTLEKSGPSLLGFINEKNFNVNYTVIPYAGVSMIDFRFKVSKEINRIDFIDSFEKGIFSGPLKNFYSINDKDLGPEIHNCSTSSVVFIKENIKVNNNQIFLHGYFDNENSANRYYDLINYISQNVE